MSRGSLEPQGKLLNFDFGVKRKLERRLNSHNVFIKAVIQSIRSALSTSRVNLSEANSSPI